MVNSNLIQQKLTKSKKNDLSKNSNSVLSHVHGRFDKFIDIKKEFPELENTHIGLGIHIYRPDRVPTMFNTEYTLKFHDITSPTDAIINEIYNVQYGKPKKILENNNYIAEKTGRVEWWFNNKIIVYVEVGFPKYITKSITVFTKKNEYVKKGTRLGKINIPSHPDNSHAGLIIPKLSIIKIQLEDIVKPNNIVAKLPEKNNNYIIFTSLLLSFIYLMNLN